MRSRLVVSLVTFVLVSAAEFVVAQGPCDKQFVVSEVRLPATTKLSKNEQAAIRARLIGSCFDDQQLDELTRQFKRTLESLGYLHASVHESSITIADTTRHPQPVSLNFEVEEGPHYKVREIEVVGNRVVPVEQIISVSQVQLEDFLDMSKVGETAEAMRKLYAAYGFTKASIVPQVRFKEGLGVCVIFTVVEGALSP